MNLWFTLTLKKIGGFKKISVGCRLNKNQVIQEYYYFILEEIYCFKNLIGSRSSLNSSKPVIFTLFMNLSFLCYSLTYNSAIK